jgi:hypothetical protein
MNRGGKSLVNTQKEQPKEERVQIVHAAHPLCGQRVRVVPVLGRQQGTAQILVELPNGERRFVPVEWTDCSVLRIYPEGCIFRKVFPREMKVKRTSRHAVESPSAACLNGEVV